MALKKIKTYSEARAFIKNAGFCLRYGANASLPVASMYQAVLGDVKKPGPEQLKVAINLTNQLLEKHEVIEVNVIADRVCLVHRNLMPALYKMITARKTPPLSKNAQIARELLEEKGEITAGDVRKHLGIPTSKTGEDPAYLILSELQKRLLVDRGPFKISNGAIPYLSREGYPYHLFEEAHPELVKEADALNLPEAQSLWLSSFLKSSTTCPLKKMASIFKNFLSKEEMENILSRPPES